MNNQINLDPNKVIEKLKHQIAELSGELAMSVAYFEQQKEEINYLKKELEKADNHE